MSVSDDLDLDVDAAPGDLFASAGGLRARYRRAGRGPAVLVLHGWGADIEAVAPIAAGLRDVCDVISVDLPGFGRSETQPGPWGVVQCAVAAPERDARRRLVAFVV